MLWQPRSAPIAETMLADRVRADLHLDRIIAAVAGDLDPYRLTEWLRRPLCDLDAVHYRQEVFADLASPATYRVFDEFAVALWRMRDLTKRAADQRHTRQRARWLLDAAAEYVRAVTRLRDDLAGSALTSRALTGWHDYLRELTGGADFTRLAADVEATENALGGVRFAVRIQDRTVEVGTCGGEPDYAETIANLFRRFGSGEPGLRSAPDRADPDPFETQVLDRVVELFPAPFRLLDRFAREHEDFADPGVIRFDREIHFYLRYLAVAERVTGDDRAMTLPRVTVDVDRPRVSGAFDLALALKCVAERKPLVCNDFRLDDAERILLVTGPNSGGKTTFARAVGQLVYLAALGCPVPASEARLPLPDRMFTHFERADAADDRSGRLLRELTAVRDTLAAATGRSVILLNESFASTTTADGLRIAGEVLGRIVALGAVTVFVTFLEGLAEGPATVGLVAGVDPEDPARRTYRLERRPADGQPQAAALAHRYGLTYAAVTARVTG
ncbi:DNA mismatch repair protein MutS [Nocardia sp. RB56]|uniref:DNA mismatch repair protein MutS n=1 Tax=Nocardia aurantia TaxID=2585199 RepID=A0A7K0DTG0_9NOCA|nr:DNA mismatch repair protein MutS [Nocardia aurantia]